MSGFPTHPAPANHRGWFVYWVDTTTLRPHTGGMSTTERFQTNPAEHKVAVEWNGEGVARLWRQTCTCGNKSRWMKNSTRVADLVKQHQDFVAYYAAPSQVTL